MATDALADAIVAVDALDDDEFNGLIDYIRDTVKTRRATRSAKARATMKVGTKVKFGTNLKPQYLQGLAGEIVEKRQTRVVVLLDCGPVGKFRSGKVVSDPASLTVVS